MICRMTKEQRECLIELITYIIERKLPGSDVHEMVREVQIKQEFNKLFANESEAEDNNRQSDLYVS